MGSFTSHGMDTYSSSYVRQRQSGVNKIAKFQRDGDGRFLDLDLPIDSPAFNQLSYSALHMICPICISLCHVRKVCH